MKAKIEIEIDVDEYCEDATIPDAEEKLESMVERALEDAFLYPYNIKVKIE